MRTTVSRHDFLWGLGAMAVVGLGTAGEAAPTAPVVLRGLEADAPLAGGLSWGVPWRAGQVGKAQAFALAGADGANIPLQTWPLAYWPDGSVKWSGFAASFVTPAVGPLALRPVAAAPAGPTVHVAETADSITIDTGAAQCQIGRRGASLVESLTVGGRVVAQGGKLVCWLHDAPDDSDTPPRRTVFHSDIKAVTVEQSGPVRATVKIEGVHSAAGRSWLPFTVRLYFYAGQTVIRLVHTVIFDGDANRDFIKGLGLSFDLPLREAVHNRHIRFAGAGDGLWAEPVQPLTGRHPLLLDGEGVYTAQLEGRRLPPRDAFDEAGQALMRDWAVWGDFRLTQTTADGFEIHKRTNNKSAWLHAGAGGRAGGMVWAGDTGGGLGVGVRNFWQSYPASLEVRGAAGDRAELRVWLWSPDAAAMDLRHYDTVAHGLDASYEDVQPGFSTPLGVARTSELTLFPAGQVPSREALAAQAQAARHPQTLVCTPEYLHAAGAFGTWSLPDRTTPGRAWVENQLDRGIAFYQKEIEQRHWYGFWNFGDVMHAYDTDRHVWRYDIGGFAWDNSELAPDTWLWVSFLRTGRADIFRMAEAMTRHTGEVDTYHVGRFAGLGSRHNVSHWGCGAKEARISQAAFRRYHYYLTTDERTGDLMHQMRDADFKTLEIDPMRLALPLADNPNPHPARARGGPDWLAFVGNWLTEWERTGNTHYRDKIIVGMNSIARMPYGLFSGYSATFGYDPHTGELFYIGGEFRDTTHLATIMGGAEVVFELEQSLRHAGWSKVWLQYCRLYGGPKADAVAEFNNPRATGGAGGSAYARLAAYAYKQTGDAKYADRAWGELLGGAGGWLKPRNVTLFDTHPLTGPLVLNPIDEAPRISTNETAQWCLNAIELLELAGDTIPQNHPLWGGKGA